MLLCSTSGPVIVESSQFETVGAVLVRCYSRCVFSEFDIADSSKCYNNTGLQAMVSHSSYSQQNLPQLLFSFEVFCFTFIDEVFVIIKI